MDGPTLIGALLGITCAVSRPMLRAFGSGPVATAKPAPWKQSWLEEALARHDWELLLGLRYDHPSHSLSPAAEDTNFGPTGEDATLLNQLESELVRAAVESILDTLKPVQPEPHPQLPDSLPAAPPSTHLSEPTAPPNLGAGQPVGAPDYLCPAAQFSSRLRAESSSLDSPEVREPAPPVEPIRIVHAPPAADLIPLERFVRSERFATIDENAGQPVGSPSVFLLGAPVATRTGMILEADFRTSQSEEEYRIAASRRKAGETYAIAAYTLHTGGLNSSSSGDDSHDPDEPDPLAELLDELERAPEPEKDPNELELPLEPSSPISQSPLTFGQPVGAPAWFDCAAPATPSPTAPSPNLHEEPLVEEDGDEPSAPISREINRISERVEHILSNALARPAPAINFKDTLAEFNDRSRGKKDDKPPGERLPSPALEDNLARSSNRESALSMAEYKVQFEIFEGPLDLLLYLVRKQEVDIYEINLTQIATEFIKYIEMMRQFDLEVAGEFLVMASTLMYLKSKELLPVEQQSQLEEEEEEDPRWELIRQLVEYKKFKDAAASFKQLELAQEDVFPRNPAKSEFPKEELRPDLSVFDLIAAVNKILERVDAREEREIFADRWTVSEKIEIIRAEILKRECVRFSELFEDSLSRTEVVATFLALLELIKLKIIVAQQSEHFEDIEIRKSPLGHTLNLDADQEEMALEGVDSEYDAPEGAQD